MTTAFWPFGVLQWYLRLANFLVSAGANLFIQSTVLIALGLALSRLLRRRGPAVQSLILRGVLVALVLSPILSLTLSRMGLSIITLPLPQVEWKVTYRRCRGGVPSPPVISGEPGGSPLQASLDEGLSDEEGMGVSGKVGAPLAREIDRGPKLAVREGSEALAASTISPEFTALTWVYFILCGLWIVGASGLLGWLAFCHILVARLRRRARLAPEDLLRNCHSLARLLGVKCPKVLISGEVKSPLLTGLFSPVIILPAHTAPTGRPYGRGGLYRPDVEEVEETVASEAVFIHELAHLKRRDCLWNFITRLLSSFLFYQPLIWLLARISEDVADDVCDDYVIHYGCKRKVYARQLTHLAERFQPALNEATVGAGVIRFRSSLGRRVVRILDASRRLTTATSRRIVFLTALGVLTTALLAGTLGFLPAAPAPKPQPTAEKSQTPVGYEAVPIKGRLLNEKGQPVEGAKVYSYSIVYYDKDEIEKETVSAADGSFSFKDLPVLKPRSAWRSIIATAEGYAIGGMGLTRESDLSDVKITLFPPSSISGRISDKKGRPIQGAKVRADMICDDPDWSRALVGIHLGENGADKFASAMTDKEGNYAINNLPQGSQVRLSVSKENYGGIYGGGLVGQEDTNFTLDSAGIIEGKVTIRTTGEAVPGLVVLAAPMENFHSRGWAKTDPRGNFRITNLQAGAYNLEIYFAEESPEWLGLGKSAIKVTEGGVTSGINLQLTKGGIIAGKVIDKETQEPIKGVRLGCWSLDYRPATEGSAVTREDGTYELRAAPGSVRISLESPEGYLNPERLRYNGGYRQVQVKEEETLSGIDFSLVKAVKIGGRVVDEDGNPLAKASIKASVWPPDSRNIIHPDQLRVKEDGRFEIDRLYLDIKVVLFGRSEELPLTGRAEVTPEKDKVSEVTLTLRKGGAVRGRVLDEKGKPLPGTKVWASLHLSCPEKFAGVWLRVGRAATDTSGNYEIKGLLPGQEYAIRSFKKGYGERSSESFYPEKGKISVVADLVLPVADSFIAGKVTDAETGKPLARMRIGASGLPPEEMHGFAYTDSEGKYRIDGLTKGRYRVYVSPPYPYESTRTETESGRDDVNFQLTKKKPEKDKSPAKDQMGR